MQHALASSKSRCRAVLLDGLLLFPLYFLDQYVGIAELPQTVVFVYFLLTWQIGWAYVTFLHGWYGRTLGKLACGIRVVRYADGGPVGLRRAAIREFPVILMAFLCSVLWTVWQIAFVMDVSDEQFETWVQWVFRCIFYVDMTWCILELLTMLGHPERRAIHDMIAGTIVVKNQPK